MIDEHPNGSARMLGRALWVLLFAAIVVAVMACTETDRIMACGKSCSESSGRMLNYSQTLGCVCDYELRP